MDRIVLVSQRHDRLISTIMKNVPDAVAATNFKLELQAGDVLCWLPQATEYVDDEVQELAALVDRSLFLPAKIVMLSVAGTADDADEKQLKQWYGKQAMQIVLAHQYAIKMIDELELPYTIIRALPLTDKKTTVQLVSEGTPLRGEKVGVEQVAAVVERAVTTADFHNQSVGVAPLESEKNNG